MIDHPLRFGNVLGFASEQAKMGVDVSVYQPRKYDLATCVDPLFGASIGGRKTATLSGSYNGSLVNGDSSVLYQTKVGPNHCEEKGAVDQQIDQLLFTSRQVCSITETPT
jgi:hypothetical protein